jgi:hypothetical protein
VRILLATALAAAAPLVPTHSQQAIRQKLPQLAYVPTRIPPGFRYYKWETTTRPLLRITFRNRALQTITFEASFQQGACVAGKQKTLQLDGNRVYWSQTAAGQQAWRCVTSPTGRLVRLATAIALPPTKFGPSGLGIVTASGRLVRAR